MDTHLAPVDVANHWPYIREQLALERWPTVDLVLSSLATRQVEADGHAVGFGTNYWRRAGLTPGEIGGATKALRRLEVARVVVSRAGRGRLAAQWAFAPSIGHWRSMPWIFSGRDVERAVCGCRYRASCAIVAPIAGHRVALSRCEGDIRISEKFHLRRPGLFPVDGRNNGAAGATTARRPGLFLVDGRDNGAANRALYLSTEELQLIDKNQRFTDCLETAHGRCGRPVFRGSEQWLRLARVFLRLDESQQDALAVELSVWDAGDLGFWNVGDVCADLASDPVVKGAAHFSPRLSEHPTRMDLSGFVPEPVA